MWLKGLSRRRHRGGQDAGELVARLSLLGFVRLDVALERRGNVRMAHQALDRVVIGADLVVQHRGVEPPEAVRRHVDPGLLGEPVDGAGEIHTYVLFDEAADKEK